jgi:hypothetical protein
MKSLSITCHAKEVTLIGMQVFLKKITYYLTEKYYFTKKTLQLQNHFIVQ